MAIALAPEERNIWRIVQAVIQLIQGRSNAAGAVTLTASATSTTVAAPNCGSDSRVFLFPTTANAAAKATTTYVKPADVARGSFKVTHASSADTDQTFNWVALG